MGRYNRETDERGGPKTIDGLFYHSRIGCGGLHDDIVHPAGVKGVPDEAHERPVASDVRDILFGRLSLDVLRDIAAKPADSHREQRDIHPLRIYSFDEDQVQIIAS
jgi:hypothetical protein